MADEPDAVPISPAATVIVMRDGPAGPEPRLPEPRLQVLLVRRDAGLAFHGGSWVFPGGRVDSHELAAAGGDEQAAARLAAVREVHEETGLRITQESLVPFSHWTTPLGRNRRFSTSFFLAPAPSAAAQVTVDDGEIREFEWFTPAEATGRSEAGHIQLAGPTYVSLLRLRPLPSVHAAIEHARSHPYEMFRPRLVVGPDGVTASVYEDDAAYHSGDLDSPGRRHRMMARGDAFDYIRSDPA